MLNPATCGTQVSCWIQQRIYSEVDELIRKLLVLGWNAQYRRHSTLDALKIASELSCNETPICLIYNKRPIKSKMCYCVWYYNLLCPNLLAETNLCRTLFSFSLVGGRFKVRFGTSASDAMFCFAKAQSSVAQRHNVLFRKDTMFCFAKTQCSVLLDTMFCLQKTQCSVHNLFCRVPSGYHPSTIRAPGWQADCT